MPILVSKFGGSSTASADCFRRILEIVRASPGRRCVVLSAPGTDAAHGEKVTALLAEAWRTRRDDRARRAAVRKIAERYGEIAAPLGVDGFEGVAAAEVEAALQISEAHALSRGEYLCAKLFSRFSDIPMVDAAALIRFDGGGALDAERTLARFIALSRDRDRAVVPGFYGADPAGRVRVFPRNGSDITGALAAAGMGAGLYENWTDVPGLMTADPAVVPEARLIPQVSYRQMRALARAGARVLHPACLDPVALNGIPTRLRCTNDPECFGTLIDDHVDGVAPCIAGRMISERLSRISVFGVPHARVVGALDGARPLKTEPTQDGANVYMPPDAFEDTVRLLHRRLIQ